MKKSKYIGYLLIISGISIFLYNYILDKIEKDVEINKIEATYFKEVSYREKEDVYDAILSIPKIKLKKGIYEKNDIRNNIEYSVMIHPDSVYPNREDSNIILMAHSGSGKKALFNDLKKLDTDSLVEFYYKHTKYIYKIENIYCVVKNGSVEIKKEYDKKSITLITCDHNNKNNQVVYIGYLIDEIKY